MKRTTLLAALVAGALTLAACGGDDSGATVAGDGAATTMAAATTAAPTTAAAAADTSTTAVDADFSGSDSDELCTFARDIEDRTQDTDLFGSTDPVQAEKDWNELLEVMETAESIAPPEIQGDFGILRDGFASIVELLRDYDYDFLAVMQAGEADPAELERLAVFDDPEYQAAAERIDVYFDEVCGIATGE